MAIDALVRPLLSLPIFRGLKPIQLTEIVRRAERLIYAPAHVIITENQVSDAAIVIVSGSCIRLDDNTDHSKGELLQEGTMLAELGMLVEIVNASTIVTQSRVKALRLTRTLIRELMEEDPALIEHFSSQLVGRLHLLAEELGAVDKILARSSTMPVPYSALQRTPTGLPAAQ
jgi:CRP-like cAMP-binding protein